MPQPTLRHSRADAIIDADGAAASVTWQRRGGGSRSSCNGVLVDAAGTAGSAAAAARAQALARRLTRPCAGVHVAYHAQPFFSLFEACEIPHVQAKALAAVFKPAADKKSEALELRRIRLRKRHRRRRRTKIDYEQIGLLGGEAVIRGIRARLAVGCQLWLQSHVSPRTQCVNRPPVVKPQFAIMGGWQACARCDVGSPAVIGTRPLDRWLCVPAFRRVCSTHYRCAVSKRRRKESRT